MLITQKHGLLKTLNGDIIFFAIVALPSDAP